MEDQPYNFDLACELIGADLLMVRTDDSVVPGSVSGYEATAEYIVNEAKRLRSD